MMLINGAATAQLDARDRGLHYGDGVFTTARIARGEVLLWERHVARLQENCTRLAIPAPAAAVLQAEMQRIGAGVERGVIKVMVTRGVGGRGYAPPQEAQPTRLVALHPWPDYPQTNWDDGVALRVNALRLARQPALAGVKHLNRLEQVLARAEWNDPTIAEGLMCNEHGDVIEATAANVFVVRNGELHTPDLSECGVAGVIRALVLEIAAALGVTSRVCRLPLDAVRGADEVFLTNSVMGVVPVCQLERVEESLTIPSDRHAREEPAPSEGGGGHPEKPEKTWIPACAGMTSTGGEVIGQSFLNKPVGPLTRRLRDELIKRVPGYA